jgi:hypothetical protein
MRQYELDRYLTDSTFLDTELAELFAKKLIRKENTDKQSIEGHLKKAEHNLRFSK